MEAGERFGVDRREFARIYAEYGDAVYSACVAILRNRDEAADAMREVFVLAVQQIAGLRDRNRLRPWLFALARHVCFRRLDAGGVAADPSLTPDSVGDNNTAALIWDATAGLNEIDRAVLFDVAQGLDGNDLTDAVGVPHTSAHALVRRARAHLDDAVGALVVARFGRADCSTLDAMLESWDGVLTPALRGRIARHIDMCETCTRTKRHTYQTQVVTGAVLSVAGRAPALTAAEVFEIALRTPLADEVQPRDGFPPLEHVGRKRRRVAFLSSAALVLGVVLVLLTSMLGNTGSGGTPVSASAAPAHAAAGAPTRRTSTPAATLPSTPRATAAAQSTATSPLTDPANSTTVPQSRTATVNDPRAIVALLIAGLKSPSADGAPIVQSVSPPPTPPPSRQPPPPPDTRPPVTKPPVTTPPVTDPPVTEPPTTTPPVTEPPTTTPPVTEPPTTTPPVTVPPITVPTVPTPSVSVPALPAVPGVTNNRAIGLLQGLVS